MSPRSYLDCCTRTSFDAFVLVAGVCLTIGIWFSTERPLSLVDILVLSLPWVLFFRLLWSRFSALPWRAQATTRESAPEDLLPRQPVSLECEQVRGVVQGRTILVTGAGGSIGSELCREICGLAPRTLILVDKGENNLFLIHQEISSIFPGVGLVPCIADIGDDLRMKQIFSLHNPQVVFHTAAHKHVPLMEANPGEAIKNNVWGTKTLADLADCHGTAEFVMISTDKAVNPTSIMGVSKRVAELYIQSLAKRSSTRFATVRFGNVLGSAGSVLPIFKEQIARGGPITVTHPDMMRYFMTIPEACQLVLQAAALGRKGEIFILDMGEPIRILDLALELIRRSGTVKGKIEIRFTGIRPGEKLFEELSLEQEQIQKTVHPRIFVGRVTCLEWDEMNAYLEELRQLADSQDRSMIQAKFKEIVPEYQYRTQADSSEFTLDNTAVVDSSLPRLHA